ncbi:hypothetical protein [Deinococcus pimensis]|uniref:hypothetical protein n=1 Tax=Deinococcus pimensis TaxID=309888 RepID=UPI0004823652|nr:hypothetical protein [Deinococcus pimensis]
MPAPAPTNARRPFLLLLLLGAVITAGVLTTRTPKTYPPLAHFPIAFQGVIGVVNIYDDPTWTLVTTAEGMDVQTQAYFDDRQNTIHMRAHTWTAFLPHEASHLFDLQTDAQRTEEIVPECASTPDAFAFNSVVRREGTREGVHDKA